MSILNELAELERLAGLPEPARRIREARVAAGITQTRLARELGLSREYVVHVEAGDAATSERQEQRFLAAIRGLAEGGQ